MIPLFKIYPIDATVAGEIEKMTNEPHRHEFEELIIGIDGCLEHFIDFDTHIVNAPFISYVTKGKLHRVRPKAKDGLCSMWVVRFRSEFIPETIFQLYSLYHNNASMAFEKNLCFERLAQLCVMMQGEMDQDHPDLGVIRQLLSTVFTMIASERKKHIEDSVTAVPPAQSVTFKVFLQLLEDNFMQPVGVDFYAGQLFMSARNLNLICQNILQQSVSEIIETRKLTEAKTLLITTDKSISEIGFELGYKEKSHFTNAFKKKSGQTPSEFREEMCRITS